MDYIEWIGKVAVFFGSWAVGGWVGDFVVGAIRKQVDARHDLRVARCLHARGGLMRHELRGDSATGMVADVDASLMRLTARGLVERTPGVGRVPCFELTPDGATILADD